MIALEKKAGPELKGPLVVRAEWNHSCTPQCPVPCLVNQAAQPGSMSRPTLDTPWGPEAC